MDLVPRPGHPFDELIAVQVDAASNIGADDFEQICLGALPEDWSNPNTGCVAQGFHELLDERSPLLRFWNLEFVGPKADDDQLGLERLENPCKLVAVGPGRNVRRLLELEPTTNACRDKYLVKFDPQCASKRITYVQHSRSLGQFGARRRSAYQSLIHDET